jgi:hypothetical protein
MPDLWSSHSPARWRSALDSYADVIAAQGVARLAELDAWYRGELPAAIASRHPRHVTHGDMVRVTEWKMARGVWRGRNLALVRGNAADEVERASRDALSQVPDPTRPIATLSKLAGVGPATASAVLAAAAPETYPFFDELVGAQVPGLGEVAFTPAYYGRYAQSIRERAEKLGDGWTPAMVERALWAHAGGKAGIASPGS